MSKRIAVLTAVLVWTAFSLAQSSGGHGGGGSVIVFAGAPSGSCSSSQTAVNSTNGNYYSCNSGAWLLVGPGAAGSATWNSIVAPTGNQAITMTAFTSTWTYNAATGAGVNLFTVTDTTNNTGTGVLATFNTASGSAVKPFQASANGNGVQMSTAGLLAALGTGGINATQLNGATFASPGAIGGTTPGTGNFTSLSISGTALASTNLSDSANLVKTTASATFGANTYDFTGASATSPAKSGTIAGKPATCTVGNIYFATDATAGQNFFYCTATNTWTQQLNSGGGMTNPMTTIGDMIGGGSAGAPARIAGGLTGQGICATNGATPAFCSPSNPVGNGGASVSLASANYTIGCDSGTAIVDRGKWIYVGTGGANSVILPDLSGSGCSGMYGGIENATSGNITVARQTADTLTVFGPSSGAPTTAATSFTLAAGQTASFGPDPTSTVYDIRVSQPTAGGSGTVNSGTIGQWAFYAGAGTAVSGGGPGTAKQVIVSGGANASGPSAIDFPETLFIPAANCNNTTAGAGWSIGSGGTVTCRAGTNNKGGFISITDTSTTFATFQVAIPEDWDTAANPYIRFQIASTDTTTGHTIIPSIQVACYKGDGTTTDDVAANAAHSLSTTTLNTTANQFWSTSNVQMNATDVTGCVAGGLMQITVGRATDTSTNAEFYGATLTFPRLLTVQAN